MKITRKYNSVAFILFAGLTAGVLAMAQPKPAASATVPNAAIQVAESPDETIFKQMLVKNSPWQTKWDTSFSSRDGTVEMSFSISEDGNLAGKLFNFSGSTADTPLKDISVKGSELRFVNARSGTAFKYRLNSDGTMSGTFEGTSSSGRHKEGTLKATPASGAKN